MNWHHIAKVLDLTIANVAETEYSRLSAGMSPEVVAARLDRAMASLLGLGQGIPADYDEWDALLYLTWYHPRQVNLALAASWPFMDEPQPLHIIDVGCGSLAMATAIAIAVAQSDLPERDVHIELHGIDPSGPMRAIGLRLLGAFSERCGKDPELSRLGMASEQISRMSGYWRTLDEYYKSEYAHERGIYPSPNCWLTAIHAIYESNAVSLRKDFMTIREQSDPAYEVVTCHDVGYRYARSVCRRDASNMRLLRDRFAFRWPS